MPTQKSTARLSKKPPLSPEELKQIDAYWRAANYLTACQLYLLDNPLLERPLCESDLKQTIVGHWGTCPGQNFIYTHLDRVIKRDDLDMIYLSGPGHGGNAMVAQDWLDGRTAPSVIGFMNLLPCQDVASGPVSASPSPTTQAAIRSGLSATAPKAWERE